MSQATPVKKYFGKPSHPDGKKYDFNCCASPDVWDYSDDKVRCRVCGHNWTSEVDNT